MSTAAIQKKALKEFKTVVSGVSDKVATEYLKKVNYNVERALDAYYQSNKTNTFTPSTPKADKSKLNKLFDKYAGDGKEKDKMSDEKLGLFFKDGGIDAEKDACTTLALAWKLKGKTLGEFSRTEFVDGFSNLGVDSIKGIQQELQTIKSSLSNKQTFKEFYEWLFTFIKDDEERKVLELEPAIEMMGLVLKEQFQLLDKYVDFLRKTKVKAITQDVWTQTLEFAREVKPDLSDFDADGAWPGVLDDFVTYLKEPKDGKKM